MFTKNTIIAVCVALLVGFGVGYYVNHQGASLALGGGVNLYPDWYYNGIKIGQGGTVLFDKFGNFQRGGVTIASTTSAVDTMTVTQLSNYSHLKLTPIVSATTLTLPASSTLSTLIPVDGNWTEKTIENATTTSGISITLAAGTGITLQTASTTGAKIDPKKGAFLRLLRLANTDIMAYLSN